MQEGPARSELVSRHPRLARPPARLCDERPSADEKERYASASGELGRRADAGTEIGCGGVVGIDGGRHLIAGVMAPTPFARPGRVLESAAALQARPDIIAAVHDVGVADVEEFVVLAMAEDRI